MARMTAARALVESLRAQGVDTIFGIISSHTMEIFDALYDHQDAIRFISTRHEQAAAMMADGYARVTGKPGICLTSTGPGAANSMGGLGEAYAASSPVLTITSSAEEQLYERGLGTMHETKNQLDMLSTVTQHSVHISRPEDAPEHVREAFSLFQDRRHRPIAIEIPSDVQCQEAEIAISGPIRQAAPTADPAAVEAAADILLAGRRVGVIAGTGVHRSGAGRELTRLVERLGAPVFTTANSKGAIAEDHPLSLGMYGGEYNFPPGGLEDPRQTFADSLDVILVVGSSLSYFRAKSQGLRQPPQLIHLDIDTAPMDKWYATTVRLVGDARTVLEQLNGALANRESSDTTAKGVEEGYAAKVREVRERIREYKRRTLPNETKIMEAIRRVTARDAVFVGDVGVCNHRGANYCLDIFDERSYLIPAWGGLGFGLPAAAGAKAGVPGRQVICITGDGGFQFNIQELGTCVQYGLRPVVLVFNDDAWGLLRHYQENRKGGRYIASDLRNPDFTRLAEAYGARGLRANSLPELVQSLELALATEKVTVIDVKTPEGFANFK
ncbi:MAG: thiamine pyrophosphate-binding protein [Caldilineaceae bacterium]|nr:thiamine pyrophosphate-binding protein [Caldilineaceae bacterium]MDE0337794.1 thiamine pyrophosphate-binding protein [Caldilineaceae bacterium]